MIEVALQTMLILAYLAIGLIAATFPIYALCVAYLKVEKSEIEKDRRDRLDVVKKKIEQCTRKIENRGTQELKAIEAEIKMFKKEKEQLEAGLESLTAKGAVRNPLIALALALTMAELGIISADSQNMFFIVLFGVLSTFFTIFAVSSFYDTIKRIESAALRKGHRVDWSISYKGGLRMKEVTKDKVEQLVIRISPEEDIEKFQAQFFVPVGIEVISSNADTKGTMPDDSGKAGCTFAIFKTEYLSSKITRNCTLDICAKQVGDHKIELTVTGKGIETYYTDLDLRVKS